MLTLMCALKLVCWHFLFHHNPTGAAATPSGCFRLQKKMRVQTVFRSHFQTSAPTWSERSLCFCSANGGGEFRGSSAERQDSLLSEASSELQRMSLDVEVSHRLYMTQMTNVCLLLVSGSTACHFLTKLVEVAHVKPFQMAACSTLLACEKC